MNFYYVIKDGVTIEARCCSKENALHLIKIKQEHEKKAHQYLHAEFSILEGKEMEFIKY